MKSPERKTSPLQAAQRRTFHQLGYVIGCRGVLAHIARDNSLPKMALLLSRQLDELEKVIRWNYQEFKAVNPPKSIRKKKE